MNKFVLLFVITLIIPTQKTHAQKKSMQGWIIGQNDDSLKVTFRVPYYILRQEVSISSIQSGIVYYINKNQKQILKPMFAKSIAIITERNILTLYSKEIEETKELSLKTKKRKVFVERIIEGKINLYYYYTKRITGGGTDMSTTTVTSYILEKDNKTKVIVFNYLNDKSVIKANFTDCSVLIKKIDEKEIKHRDIEEIVHFYNENCH